jgi:hypothetical protein
MKLWHRNYSKTMNDKTAGRIVGAILEPCKVKKQLQLRMQDPNPANLKQKKIKKQAPIGPTAGVGP